MRIVMPGRARWRTPVMVSTIALAILTAPVLWSAGAAPPPPQDPGSLVQTSMQSEVGVVLDELPTSMRDRVASALVAKPSAFWKERASAQLRLTVYRLVFRQYFHSAARSALPLPPEPLWNITLAGTPARRTVDGHDVVSVPYQFSSTLLSDFTSPGVSEPQLAKIGGTWDEPFILPIDPELLFQRTGFACMDEESFPFNSVDSEEVDSFYDQTAVVGKVLSNVGSYHFTRQPTESCVEALQNHVGRVVTSLRFRRLVWNATVASQVRFGHVTGNEPDLQIYVPDFLPSRTNYRYVHATGSGSCEVEEGSVGGTGWRRLLQFATSDENVGNRALTIGGVDYTLSGHAGELDLHNLFELSPCHQHYHFKYYGDLGWADNGTIANSKLGFCLQSTNRVANREGSPLHEPVRGLRLPGRRGGVGRPVQGRSPEPVARHHRPQEGRRHTIVPVQPERVPLRGDVRGRERRPARLQRSGGMGTDRADRGERRAGGGSAVREDPDLGRQQLRHRRRRRSKRTDSASSRAPARAARSGRFAIAASERTRRPSTAYRVSRRRRRSRSRLAHRRRSFGSRSTATRSDLRYRRASKTPGCRYSLA